MGKKKKKKSPDIQPATRSQAPAKCQEAPLWHGTRQQDSFLSTRWPIAKRIGSWLWRGLEALAILGVIGVYYQFSPNLSLVPSVSFSASDPFHIPFVISNNGYWDLKNIVTTCHLIQAYDTHNGYSANNLIETDGGKSPRLSPGEGLSVSCGWSGLSSDAKVAKADITMRVMFDLLLYGQQTRYFRFVAAKDSADQWHWLPQPCSKRIWSCGGSK